MENLIIVTSVVKKRPPYMLWIDATKNKEFKSEDDSLTFSNEKFKLWVFAEKKEPGECNTTIALEERAQEIAEKIKKLLRQNKDKETWFYIAAHTPTFRKLDLKQLKKEEGIERLAFRQFLHEPDHSEYKDFYAAAEKSIKSPNNNHFRELREEINKNFELNEAHLLRHNLTKILAPVEINLQGLIEAKYNEDYCDEIVTEYERDADRLIEELIALKTDCQNYCRKSEQSEKDLTPSQINIKEKRRQILDLLEHAIMSDFVIRRLKTEEGIKKLKSGEAEKFFDWYEKLKKTMESLLVEAANQADRKAPLSR